MSGSVRASSVPGNDRSHTHLAPTAASSCRVVAGTRTTRLPSPAQVGTTTTVARQWLHTLRASHQADRRLAGLRGDPVSHGRCPIFGQPALLLPLDGGQLGTVSCGQPAATRCASSPSAAPNGLACRRLCAHTLPFRRWAAVLTGGRGAHASATGAGVLLHRADRPGRLPERNRSDGVLEFIVARAAGELDLQAVRADQLAEPGQITLQVIEHVLGAKAGVADLTGRNPNVYYELAIRHTAKLPTVLICEQGEDLPFDIAQMRTIFFRHTDLRSADDCRTEIVRQLREALEGAVDSPVAASVDLQRLQAGNTVERNVAELVTGVADLHRAMQDIEVVVRSALEREALGDLRYASQLRAELDDRLEALLRLAEERKDTEMELRLAEVQAWVRGFRRPGSALPPTPATRLGTCSTYRGAGQVARSGRTLPGGAEKGS